MKTLEEEFKERVINHKSYIIMLALVNDKTQEIYDCNLLKDYKNMQVNDIEGYEGQFDFISTRAYRVEEDLDRRAENGEKALYDSVYEYCWHESVGYLDDDDTPENFRLSKEKGGE